MTADHRATDDRTTQRKGYADGFIIPVKPGRKGDFVAMASSAAPIFLEHGATRVVECWADDLSDEARAAFGRAVEIADGESVVFSWVEWPSKEARDIGNMRIVEDPRLEMPADTPIDERRIVYGGFSILLDSDIPETNQQRGT